VSPEVRLARPEDLPAVYALRHDVFVLGQDVPEELERDEHDDVVDHGVALVDGVVLATGRLLPPTEPGGAATVGRMAVAEAARGQGLGAAVLDLLERTARERGWPAVELHAQIHATGFYERAGYTPYGDVYLEAGIEHLSMRKQL
jgi:predicted GNAT family N-acyltransferase